MIPDTVFTLAKAKAHLRVTHALEDDAITAYLDAAVAACERLTRRAWTKREWSETIASGACGCGAEFHALLSPATAKVFAGAVEVVPTDVITTTVHGHTVVSVRSWGVFTATEGDAGRIDYTANPPGDAVPPDVVSAAMLYLGDLFRNREAQLGGMMVAPNPMAEMLLRPYVLELHA